ncbi:MAG: hypothetical protein COU35_01875 [Candidatus Magasanikbacteria bacterium CG10_big_fil_rev_8_21_14_0_10_47_10]|uniref:Uncharacterized protein n=1 Tax=Candidatus Magasanikbacteria bacterium CG10_big_fil_rev_8_21_14_0_10_47_10 TaxID=1974652 RepID=A0A2H0TQX9_9BACT|nr:MAG: hypothetical protein COU35_01875 [Candidatus Magasanikbacteria bacterium CG10_big_fil_rev_8_21_14_0_10_47_10]
MPDKSNKDYMGLPGIAKAKRRRRQDDHFSGVDITIELKRANLSRLRYASPGKPINLPGKAQRSKAALSCG